MQVNVTVREAAIILLEPIGQSVRIVRHLGRDLGAYLLTADRSDKDCSTCAAFRAASLDV